MSMGSSAQVPDNVVVPEEERIKDEEFNPEVINFNYQPMQYAHSGKMSNLIIRHFKNIKYIGLNLCLRTIISIKNLLFIFRMYYFL